MSLQIFTTIGVFLFPSLINAQVASVKLIVQVPNVPEGRSVYVAGSFNAWKAGDSLYKMKKEDKATYSIVLPVYKNVTYQYKYTTGGWNSVETALNDSNRKNRSFISQRNKKKIKDTVWKWASPKAPAEINPQMSRINTLKDSVLKGLQPKLNEMLQLLREYSFNLLQENPSMETDKRITSEVVDHFRDAYSRINDLFHKVFGSLTAQQKQQILTAVSAPAAEKDFINALGAAFNDAVNK